mgnify:CR=1 FL=1
MRSSNERFEHPTSNIEHSTVFELKSTSRPIRRALLVGIHWRRESHEEAVSLLKELGELVDTLGIEVTEKLLVKARQAHAHFLLGSGKTQEVF